MDNRVLKMIEDMQALIIAAKERDRLVSVVKELSEENKALRAAAESFLISSNGLITGFLSNVENLSLSWCQTSQAEMREHEDCEHDLSVDEPCQEDECNSSQKAIEVTLAPAIEEEPSNKEECDSDDDDYDDDCDDDYDDDCDDDDEQLVIAQTEGLIHGCEI